MNNHLFVAIQLEIDINCFWSYYKMSLLIESHLQKYLHLFHCLIVFAPLPDVNIRFLADRIHT